MSEFERLRRMPLTGSMSDARSGGNARLNRYFNVLPFDAKPRAPGERHLGLHQRQPLDQPSRGAAKLGIHSYTGQIPAYKAVQTY